MNNKTGAPSRRTRKRGHDFQQNARLAFVLHRQLPSTPSGTTTTAPSAAREAESRRRACGIASRFKETTHGIGVHTNMTHLVHEPDAAFVQARTVAPDTPTGEVREHSDLPSAGRFAKRVDFEGSADGGDNLDLAHWGSAADDDVGDLSSADAKHRQAYCVGEHTGHKGTPRDENIVSANSSGCDTDSEIDFPVFGHGRGCAKGCRPMYRCWDMWGGAAGAHGHGGPRLAGYAAKSSTASPSFAAAPASARRGELFRRRFVSMLIVSTVLIGRRTGVVGGA